MLNARGLGVLSRNPSIFEDADYDANSGLVYLEQPAGTNTAGSLQNGSEALATADAQAGSAPTCGCCTGPVCSSDQSALAAGTGGQVVAEAASVLASVSTMAAYLTSPSNPTSSDGAHFGSVVSYNLSGLGLAGEQTLARAAMAVWARVANITFVETTGTAQISFTDAGVGNNAFANTYYTGTAMTSATVTITQGWYLTDGGAQDGLKGLYSYVFQTYIHELGHALGLGHQGPYNGSATYGVDNIYTNDSWAYSVMSYFDQTKYGFASLNYLSSAMQVDVLAIQSLYGAPAAPTTRTFGYGADAGAQYNLSTVHSFTIYSSDGYAYLNGGGYSGAQTVKFNAGSFSSLAGYADNIALATTTHLSNYYGGGGVDTVFFGSLANGGRYASGGAGNDVFYNDGASSGASYIYVDGGSGSDTFQESSGVAGYTFQHTTQSTNGWTIVGAGAYDLLFNVESVTFGGSGAVTLRQSRSDFNFGTASDVGATSDFILRDASGNLYNWTIQGAAIAGSGSFGSAAGLSVLGTGDFNGDGNADILFRNNSTNQVLNWTIKNSAYVASTVIAANGAGASVVGIGDVNNDGTSDVVYQVSSVVSIWKMTNGVASGVTIGSTGTYTAVGVGDFNGDGASDVLLQSSTGYLASWNLSNGLYSSSSGFGNAAGYSVVGVADVNGDGTSDILIKDSGGTLYDLIVKNGSIVDYHAIGNMTGWNLVGTGDYNGDGVADIALQSVGGQYLATWNLSNGVFASASLVAGGLFDYSVLG
jgi:serralysin